MNKVFSAFKELTIQQGIDAQLIRKMEGGEMGWGDMASR